MNKIISMAVLPFALATAASQAHAVSFVDVDGSVEIEKGSPLSWTVNYNGIVEGTPIGSLTSKIDFAFTGVSDDDRTFKFTYQVFNTSTTVSRVSMFGMNIDPNILSAVSTGIFPKDGSGNAPQIGNVDVCFHNRNGNGSNCAGGAGTGVQNGASSSSNPLGTFELTFSTVPTNLKISFTDFYVRYQSIEGVTQGTSGVGLGTPVIPNTPDAVPEPAAWALMLGGFGLAGAAMRRRNSKVVYA